MDFQLVSCESLIRWYWISEKMMRLDDLTISQAGHQITVSQGFGTPLAVGKPYTASGKDIFWPDDIEL